MGVSQAQQTSVMAVGREEAAVPRVTALGREAVPKVSAYS